MIGPAFPLAPILGQVFKGFAYTRQGWTKAKPRTAASWTNVQVFRSSGTYVPSEDLLYAIVECVGPGGGGGWATGDVDGVQVYATAAGGGGSGGYSRSTISADLLVQGADVVVGAGGIVSAGVIGGGTTAGVTNFGGLVIAMGGGDAQAFDGVGNVVGAHGAPGAGAPAGTGDFTMPGASGDMWAAISVNIAVQHLQGARPGLGGQLFGGARWPVPPWIYTNAGGMNGLPNSGAGGGGAQVMGGSQATMFGGAGGTGICVVTEFCGTEDGGPGPEPPIVIPPGWPPGVPFKVNLRAHVVKDPNPPPVVEPVK